MADSDDGPATAGGRTRRSFLAAAGGAAVGLASTAGCVELLPPLGQTVRRGDVDPPGAGAPAFRQWVPADGTDLPLGVVAVPNSDAASRHGATVRFGGEFLLEALDYFGVGFGNYDLAAAFGSGWFVDAALLEGPVRPDEVAATLLDSGYDDRGRARGYRWFGRDDGPRAVAATEGRLLFARRPEPRAALEHLLDVRAGDASRRVDEEPAFDRVAAAAGLRPFSLYGHGVVPDAAGRDVRAGCQWYDLDDEHFYLGTTGVFEEPVESAEALRSEAVDAHRDAIALEVTVDGRLATIAARYPAAEGLPEEGPGTTTPQVTWGVDERDGALLLRHEAGEPVPADRLTLLTDADRSALQSQFSDDHATVGPGDAVEVDRSELRDGALVVEYRHDGPPDALFTYEP